MESGNKLVVEARLKGGGMHWARPHVNPMLGLRNIVCSDRWAGEWPRIARRSESGRPGAPGHPERKQVPGGGWAEAGESGAKLSLKLSLVDRPEVPVKSPVVVAVSSEREGSKLPHRPAASHPWRRAPVGRAR